jgi:sulfur carrier protein
MILVNEEPLDWHEGITVREVIRARNYRFPMLVVHVGDRLIPKQDYGTTTIPDGAVVKVIHLISGG